MCTYRSRKLLLCNNTAIWRRKHCCNSISKYCQFPEWRCSYFYYNVHYVSINKLFLTHFNSDGGACISTFEVLVIRMSYAAKKYGEILWYSNFLLQKIAGRHFSQESNLDLFNHPPAILYLAFSAFCSFLEHLQ